MKRFTFPLEGLLKARRLAEQGAERRLRQAHAAVRDAEAALTEAEERRRRSAETRRQGLHRGGAASSLALASDHERLLARQCEAAAESLSTAHKQVHENAEHYRQCHRECESIEELRARSLEEWQAELQREEGSAADERVLRDFALAADTASPHVASA